MPGASSILLTGASGFVGRRLAARLRGAVGPDAHLVALDRGEAPAGWIPAQIDIRDEGAVADLVAAAKPEVVVHLAAQASVAVALGAAEETWRTNFGGTLAVAAAVARHASDATFLFTSTSEVYGASFAEGVATEETPLRPVNAYARSKAACEAMLLDVLAPTNRLIVTRAFNHTGTGQNPNFVLPSFALQIARIGARLQPPRLSVGNLDVERDFMHVDDVVGAYLALVDRRADLPERAVFNVCSGRPRRLKALVKEMGEIAGVSFEIAVDPARLRKTDIRIAAGEATRLRDAVGWAPRVELRALLEELITAARAGL